MAPWWLRSQEDTSRTHSDLETSDPLAGATAEADLEAPSDTASDAQPVPAVHTDGAKTPPSEEKGEAAEEVSKVEADAGPETVDDDAPRRKRRRRRKRRAEPSTDSAPEPNAAAGSEPAVDDSPAAAAQAEDTPTDASDTVEEAGRRETADGAEEPRSDEPEPEPEEVVDSAPKAESKKRRRKRSSRKVEATADEPSFHDELEDVEVGSAATLEPTSADAIALEGAPGNVIYVPERGISAVDERKIAIFIDFENVALGVRDSEVKSFDISLILERLLEKGKIIVKRAYADWERYSDAKRQLHEAAIELIDIPQKRYSGKNSADIKMVVDAMDLCYSKDHLDTFVLVSGDSDFSPLVSKLKENDKFVIGMGVKNASSHLLTDNCDEFIYYEDVWRDTQRAPRLDHLPSKEAQCFELMVDAMLALFRDNKDVIWGSMLKQTMQRKKPSFNEGYYGYDTFSGLLLDAEKKGIVRLRRDRRSGSYVVVGFATGPKRRDSP